MKKLIYFILLATILSECNSSKYINNNTSKLSLIVQDISEYDYAYKITSINSENADTIVIISYKDKFFDKYDLEKPKQSEIKSVIRKNKKYKFDLIKIKPQVSTMEQFGAFIIIEKDTVLKSINAKSMPKIFVSQNTIGKLIYN